MDALDDVDDDTLARTIEWIMTRCFRCEGRVEWGAQVCENCGCELVEHSKN